LTYTGIPPQAAHRVRIFTNQIEFHNPGGMPKPYEELKGKDISLPRNPILAKLFRMVKLAENAGMGLEKLEENWNLYAHRAPEYDVEFDSVVVHFEVEKKQELTEQVGAKSGSSRDQVGTKSAPSWHQVASKSGPESGPESGAQLRAQSEAQSEKILNILQKEALSANDLLISLGLKSRTGAFKRSLQELLGKGHAKWLVPFRNQPLYVENDDKAPE
jgi:predicted HTH transcriptional regulator